MLYLYKLKGEKMLELLNQISPFGTFIAVIVGIVTILKFHFDLKKEIVNVKIEVANVKIEVTNVRTELKQDISNLDMKIEKLNSKFDKLDERLNSTNQSLYYTIPRVERLENQIFISNGYKKEHTAEIEYS